MFTSLGASEGVRRPRGGARHGGALAATSLILVLMVVGVASADPPSPADRLSAAEAAQSGAAIRLARHAVPGDLVLEVIADRGSAAAGLATTLLAVAPDGEAAALADRVGEPSGLLTLARSDGSQLRVLLPGLLAASFSPDGRRLMVIDGRGSVWQIDAESGDARALGDGPFLGAPIVLADGSLLLLAVSSVEAPHLSRLVRFEPASGVATPVSGDELVYAAFPLDDGGVAFAVHEPGHTVVRRIRIGDTASELVADLGADAVNASVSGDGRTIAFEASGSGIFVIDRPGALPRRLGDGTSPCLATDGSALLVRRGVGTLVLALDGSTLAELDGAARFVGSEGCPS
jgi:hypothetical protein